MTNSTVPLFSIIIPVYNVENYISGCIDSILIQTNPNFELLLINDGSKDGSGKICDEYAQMDDRIRVFHKTNSGVSASRNLGIDMASGDWVSFIDSDDWVAANFLDAFGINTNNSKLHIQGLKIYDHVGAKIVNERNGFSKDKTLPTIDGILKSISVGVFAGPCSRAFSREILRNKQIKFNSNISNGEDTLFNFQYCQYIDTIHFVPQSNYFVRRGHGGNLSLRIPPVKERMLLLTSILASIDSIVKYETIQRERFAKIRFNFSLLSAESYLLQKEGCEEYYNQIWNFLRENYRKGERYSSNTIDHYAKIIKYKTFCKLPLHIGYYVVLWMNKLISFLLEIKFKLKINK